MTVHIIDPKAAPRVAAELLASAPPGAALIWRFDDAPQALRDLSENGGDEDWLVLCRHDHPALDYGGTRWVWALDTCDEPDRHDLPGGYVVLIGSHA